MVEKVSGRTSQGLEIIPNCPTPLCRFCGEANHYGTCAEMRAEQQRNDPQRGRPVPNVRTGP
jgi:hypothetical protein